MPQLVHAVCPHDCPDTCSMLVTVENGKAIKIAGNPDHSFTQGFLCTKVARYLERSYHPDRLLYPQVRVGKKGEGTFRRVTWDEALDRIAQRLQSIIDRDGPEAILPFSYGGTLGFLQGSSMDRRFFHKIGASLLARTICSTAGGEAYNMTYGSRMGTDPETVDQAKLILLWGTNTLTSNPHLWPFIKRAHANGARTICIDPLRTRTADACDEHIPIRPGTDAALALGMMHVIFRDGREDRRYLDAMTGGWSALREKVLDDYSPSSVAKICRLPESVIETLGTLYATTRPSFIRLNYGLQRHAGGGNAVRAISILPAITGAWNDVGGGCQLSSSGTYDIDIAALERPDLIPPGTRTINMTTIGDALTGELAPPIRALVVYNSNPAAIAPERRKVLEGLRRDDLFTVVLEHFQTDTADYTDVLLPATTQLEHEDLHKSYGHLYMLYSERAIEPLGESLPNTEIFRRIAARMNLDDPALCDSDRDMIEQALAHRGDVMSGITPQTLMSDKFIRLNVPSPHLPFRSGSRLVTPSGRIELEPLPSYVPPYESEERDPELARRYPLALISPPSHGFLNTTFVNVASLRRVASNPTLEIHADDARARGIAHGARVSVHNDRGRFSAEAVISDRVRPGVVSAPSIWWGKLVDDGANANDTTSQRLTDIGAGATFYDNLVEVLLTQSETRSQTSAAPGENH